MECIMFKTLFKLIKMFAIFIAAIFVLGFAISTYQHLTDTSEEAAAREQARIERQAGKKEEKNDTTRQNMNTSGLVTTTDVPFWAGSQQELARELCRNAFEVAGHKTTTDEWLFVEYKGAAENQHPHWEFRLPGKPWKDCAVLYKNDVMTVSSIITGGINNNHKHIIFNHENGETISNTL